MGEAADAVGKWSNYPAAVSWTVEYRDDMSEVLSGVDAFESVYGADLFRIRSLWVEIRSDRDAYFAERHRLEDAHRAERDALWEMERERASRGEEPDDRWKVKPSKPEEPVPLLQAAVLLRFRYGRRGVYMEVLGEDRHQVSGLFDRLSSVLTDRQALRRFDPSLALATAAPLLAVTSSIGLLALLVLDSANENGEPEWSVVVAAVVVPALLALAALAYWLLYPRLSSLTTPRRHMRNDLGPGSWEHL